VVVGVVEVVVVYYQHLLNYYSTKKIVG